MSGRSAYVRAKNTQQADKKSHRQQSDSFDGAEDQQDVYSNRPAFSANPSYVSSPRPRRRQSVSSSGSTYGYPPPSMRKPRPIIVASAIEKSDFRTHLDGMSATLRGKLGRMLRHSDDGNNNNSNSNNQQQLGKRLGATTAASTDSDYTTPSTHFTPSLGAVPSLTPSTSPSDDRSGYYSSHQSQTHTIRSKHQNYENALHKIRSFEGGGKLPQLGWKSLSNVCSINVYVELALTNCVDS
ncbi:MAG: hypothetical protein Q9183_002602 [Haloplaca sp. 2 TL-2023]